MWDKPVILNWIANVLYALSVVLLIYGCVYVVVHLPVFPIREVKVSGNIAHVNRAQVALIMQKHLTGNFFTLDLVKTRDAFEKLPWARQVSVRRRWPDQLNIEIQEHQALARWGDRALVNTYGELFQAASDADLPTFYGPADGVKEVTKQYAAFSKALNHADIKIAQVSLSARRAWEVKTNKKLVISLGRIDMVQRLIKFVKAYDAVLSNLNANIRYVDLRYPNGFAVRKPKKTSMHIIPTAQVNVAMLG